MFAKKQLYGKLFKSKPKSLQTNKTTFVFVTKQTGLLKKCVRIKFSLFNYLLVLY